MSDASHGDPTPAEIERRAAEIRAGWSEDEHIKRRRQGPPIRMSRAEGDRVRAAAADALAGRIEAPSGSMATT